MRGKSLALLVLALGCGLVASIGITGGGLFVEVTTTDGDNDTIETEAPTDLLGLVSFEDDTCVDEWCGRLQSRVSRNRGR